MSQEEQRVGGNSPGGTGTLCTDTSLYKTTDNKVEYIELTLAADGNKTTFNAVKVDAGSL